MEEQLINFETAKVAKELGFDNIYCHTAYCIGYLTIKEDREFRGSPRNSVGKQFHLALAPTQALLQKWLREVHKIDIGILFNNNHQYYWFLNGEINTAFDYNGEESDTFTTFKSTSFDTYEEALEAALVEALKLIKA